MSTRIDKLITHIRKATENEEVGTGYGIQDSEFIRYLNEAQDRLVSKITQQHPAVFVEETTIDTVANQEAYDIPADAIAFNRVTDVQYSAKSLRGFYTLNRISLKERDTDLKGEPLQYIRKAGQILLSPIPTTSSGQIRLNYIRRPRDLDTRRGKVDSVTLGASSITALSLDHTQSDFDDTNLNLADYITVVDRYGSVKMKNIPIDSVSAVNGDVTITSGFTFSSGETIEVGDYVVIGGFSSTHSELPDTCERYLSQYVIWKIFKRDSSSDANQAESELSALENEIISLYADIDDDLIFIPIISDWEAY
jgi:hypothetical protein